MRAIASWWIAAVLLAATARAERIRWFCDPGSVNLDSSGTAMDAGFEFQLGVFDAGFEPTAGNRHQWLDHWNAAQSASYDAVSGRFTEELEIFDNDPPFTVGRAAWVFGRKESATGDEWILFRSAAWLWPEVVPFSPEPLQWNAADADVVPAGEVDGGAFLMRSQRIRRYDQWRTTELIGEAEDGPEEDADADGVANVVEFLCGTDPRDPGSRPVASLDPGGASLRAAFPMDPGSLAVATVEGSGDLVGWDDTGILVERSGATLVATDSVTVGSGTPRFLRLRVEMP